MAHVLQQEAACMAVMLSNACMVHKLVSCWGYCVPAAIMASSMMHVVGGSG